MEENSSIDVLVRYQEDEVIVLELIVSSTFAQGHNELTLTVPSA
jgi:hypothetical protein